MHQFRREPRFSTDVRLASILFALGCLAVMGCGHESAAETDTTGSSGSETESTETGEPLGVQFWQDVAPIYYHKCVSCHQDGGIAPFALDTFEVAQTWGPASAAATGARVMPPWLVRDDGSCGSFRDSRALSEQEITTIQTWVDDGMLEGTPRSDLMVPVNEPIAEAIAIKTPQFLPEPQGGPLAQYDEYRCFLVEPGLEHDTFLTAYDVVPGNPEIVHHVLAMPVDPDLDLGNGVTNMDVMQALDAESPDRDGWPCFGQAGDGVEVDSMPVVWAPGQGVVRYPEGTGNRVPAGSVIVVQVHYNLDRPELIGMSDSSEVHIELRDEVEIEGMYLTLDSFLDTLFDEPESLPAGEELVTYEWEEDLGSWAQYFGWPSMTIRGVFPHMHEFGRTLRFDVDPDGQGYTCAADVPSWDFNWQLQYFLEQPLTLNELGKVRVTCGYNTMAADGPVLPGWGTGNEMCLVGLFLTPE